LYLIKQLGSHNAHFLKIGEMAKWKLLSIAWEIFHLKFSLEKMNLEKRACFLKKKTFASLK